jgi:hypothetical protein
MLGLGDMVMLPKPGQKKEHPWALITAPDPQSGEAVMVNLTTQRPHSDTTTVLQPGEHPFADHPTVVFYADARMVNVSRLEGGLRQGFFRQHAALSPQVLQRIQSGLLASPFTPAKIKAAFHAARQRGLA